MSFKNSVILQLVLIVSLYSISLFNSQLANAQFSAQLSSTSSICSGSDVVLDITGGNAPYTIAYSLNGTQSIVTTGGPGYTNPFRITVTNPNIFQISFQLDYVLDATSSGSATLVGTTSLLVYPVPHLDVTLGRAFTNCQANKVLVSNPVGTPPFKIQASDGSNTWVFQGLSAAPQPPIYIPSGVTFNLQTITDGNNCVGPLSNSLFVQASPLTIVANSPVTSACGTALSIQNPIAGYTYQWYYEGVGLPQATATTYNAFFSGKFYVVGTSITNGCPITSNYIKVTVTNGPAPSQPLVTPNVAGPYTCGQTATLSLNGAAIYDIYTWRKNGTVIQQGNSSTLTINSSGSYDLTVQNTGGCPSQPSIPFNAVFQPSGFTAPVIAATATTINCWETSTLSVSNGVYDTYQWLRNNVIIPGATNPTYDVTQTGGTFSVKASLGVCNVGTSNQIAITVNPVLLPVLNQFAVFNLSLNSGLNVLRDISNNVYDSYQWQTSTDGSTYTDIPGANLVSYTFTKSNTYYRLKVYKGSCSAFSGSAYAQVSPAPKVSPVLLSSSPMIMCSSTGQLIADPGYSGYQWYKNTVLLPGETANTIDVGKTTNGSGNYKVMFTDSYGLTFLSQNSNVLVLADITPVVTVLNPNCSGELGSLNISQPAASSGVYKHYTWTNSLGVVLYDFDVLRAPNNTANIAVPSGNYTLTVTDFGGCTSTQTVTVNAGATSPSFTPVLTSNGITTLCRVTNATSGINLQVSNISSLPAPSAGNVYLYQWLVNGIQAPLAFTPGLPPTSVILGSAQYSALSTGTYTLQIKEVYNGYPFSPAPAGWVPSQCFGVSNPVALNVDFTPNPNFTFSNTSLCPGKDLTITFTGQASINTVFTWNFGTAGDYTIVSGSGSGPYVLRYATGGIKSISLSLNNGICPVQSATKTFTVLTPTPIAITTQQLSIYSGCQSILQIFNTRTIDTWSGGPFTIPQGSLTGSSVAAAIPTQTTTYTVTGTDFNGCPTSGSITINVLPATPNTNFSYGSSLLCQNNASAVNPIFTGTAVNGHFFTVDKPGLAGFDPYNGSITPANSVPGIYNVSNTFAPSYTNGVSCPNFRTTIPITIIAKPLVNYFNYPLASYCNTGGVISPSAVQTAAGSYSFYPTGLGSPVNGLDLNTINGQITLANCSTGTYMVRFTAVGDPACSPTFVEATISVTKASNPAVSYPQTTYCNNVSGSQAIPNASAVSGQYSLNPWNLNINQQSGVMDLYNANPGTYTVTKTIYSPFGPCPTVSASTTLIVYAPKVAGSFYYTNSANAFVNVFCEGTTDMLTPNFTPITGMGTLSISPVPAQGWSSTGINMALLPSGLYTITNTLTDPQCNSTTTTSITLTVKPKPSVVSIADQIICSGTNLNQPISSTPAGSIFSWTSTVTSGSVSGNYGSSGLSINQTLGLNYPANTSGTVKYTITPTFNSCPGNPVDILVTVNPVPALTPFANKTICSGTTLSVPLSTNIPGANISWVASQSSGTVTGFSSGSGSAISQTLTGSGVVTYSITSSLNGCSSLYNFVVTVNPTPALTVTLPSLNICNGSNINQTLTGTPAGTYFNWTTTVTSGSLTGFYAGGGNTINQGLWLASGAITSSTIKYTVTPGLNGCFGTPADMIVTVNPIPVMATISNKTICSGTTISVPLITNLPGAVTTWTASLGSGTVTGFSAGSGPVISQTLTGGPGVVNYSITSSLNGCSTVSTFTTTVNPTPIISVNLTSSDVCAGTQVIYSYTKPSGFTNPVPSNIPGSSFSIVNSNITTTGGTYTLNTLAAPGSDIILTVTNPYTLCSTTSTSHVNIKPIPVITANPLAICEGNGFSLPVTSTVSGSTISWTSTITGTVSGFPASGNQVPIAPITASAITGSGTITYTITASANGCNSVPKVVTVTVNPSPPISLTVTPTLVCQGASVTVVRSFPASGGFTFSYNRPVNFVPGTSSTTTVNGITTITESVTAGAFSGNFTFTSISTLSCVRTATVSMTVTPLPIVLAGDLTICEGSDLSLPITSSIAGSTFSWTSTFTGTLNGLPVSGTTVPITATAVAGSGTKTYIITATAALCTSVPKTVVVTVNPSLPISLTVTPLSLCEGTNVTAVRSYPAPATGYIVTYTRPAGFMVGNNSLSPSGSFITASETVKAGPLNGNFVLNSVSPAGCIRNITIPVVTIPEPTVSASDITICEGAGLNIPLSSPTPAVTYKWSLYTSTGTVAGFPGGGLTDHINAVAITGSGTIRYKINSVSTLTGCVSEDLYITVTVNPNLASSLSVSPTTVCQGSNVSVSRSWYVGYTTVYTRPAGFTFNNGGGGSNGVTAGAGESVTAGATSGDFIFTVTSPLGCVSNHVVTVNVIPAPTISALNVSVCEGAGFSLPLSSTTPGVTYSWTATGQTGTIAGYPVSGTLSQIIGDAAALTGNGTITYRVNSISTSTGCVSANLFVTVTVNPNLPSFFSVTPTTVCEGATVTASVDYPFGYTANYIRGAGFTILGGGPHFKPGYNGFSEGLRAGSTSGNFQLIVTSPAGCVSNITVPITVLTAPTITATDAIICEGSGFDIPLSSSTSGVTYTWLESSSTGTVSGFPNSGTTNHITAATITGNGSITYRVNSISSTGCNSANLFVTVTVNPNAPHIASLYDVNSNPIGNVATICQGTEIIFAAQTPAGYTFTYTPPSSTDFQNTNGGGGYNGFSRWYLATSGNDGLFTYTSVSSLGCTRTSTYNVYVNAAPSAPVINISSNSVNAICAGSSGSYGYNIEAGISYSVSYDAGLIANGGMCGQNLTNYGCGVTWGESGGFVYVTGTNQNGCSTSSSRFVAIQPTPVIDYVSPNPICSGNTTSILLHSVPDFMSIRYEWESFVSSGTINGKHAGESVSTGLFNAPPGIGYTINEALTGNGTLYYNITATSLNLDGCSNQTTIYQEVLQPSSPSVTVSYSPTFLGSVPQVSQIVFTAYPVNCGSNPVYQWKVNGVNVAGANGPTYHNSNLIFSSRGNIADRVSCTVTSSDPCSNGVQVTSPEVIISCGICRMAANLTSSPLPDQTVAVYPNPFSESIHVNIPGSFDEEVELIVKDMKGIEVERLKTSSGEADLGLHLKSGVYILQMTRKSGTETFKIIKAE